MINLNFIIIKYLFESNFNSNFNSILILNQPVNLSKKIISRSTGKNMKNIFPGCGGHQTLESTAGSKSDDQWNEIGKISFKMIFFLVFGNEKI